MFPKNKVLMMVSAFVAGPSFSTAADMVQWLDKERTGKEVRLPVYFDAATGESKLGSLAAQKPIAIQLDDTRMGISLQARIEEHCEAGWKTCHLWLDGSWGATDRIGFEDGPIFVVRSVDSKVKPEEASELKVYLPES